MVFFGAGCEKNNGNRTDSGQNQNEQGNENGNENENGNGQTQEPEKPSVKTGAENLVLHISFDNDNLIEVGEGVTFKENKGEAKIATGFIGQGWSNKSANNTKEAYSKFEVGANSAFTKIESVTFSCWVKLIEGQKGAIISLNGGRSGSKAHDFPAFIVYFDNSGTNEEQVKWQQVNGRLIFHDGNGNEQNLWLDTSLDVLAQYDEWYQFAFTYDTATGDVILYKNGQEIQTKSFELKIPFNNLVTEFADALYVGAWSTFVEGDSVQTWQSYWAGGLDEIRLYNKAFSADEMLELYKEELNINLEQE